MLFICLYNVTLFNIILDNKTRVRLYEQRNTYGYDIFQDLMKKHLYNILKFNLTLQWISSFNYLSKRFKCVNINTIVSSLSLDCYKWCSSCTVVKKQCFLANFTDYFYNGVLTDLIICLTKFGSVFKEFSEAHIVRIWYMEWCVSVGRNVCLFLYSSD